MDNIKRGRVCDFTAHSLSSFEAPVPSAGATPVKYAALSFGPGETKKVHGFTG
jgi:hypothetical protein